MVGGLVPAPDGIHEAAQRLHRALLADAVDEQHGLFRGGHGAPAF